MKNKLNKLRTILSHQSYGIIFVLFVASYLLIYMSALGDVIFSGGRFSLAAVEWTKMFKRSGYLTFEPIYRLTTPALTILISPINVLIGLVVSGLVGLNLTVTVLAFRQPRACSFNRTSGILASLPALLAGGACCAPVIVLILGLQMSTLVVTLSQFMIPIAIVILATTLLMILNRTTVESIDDSGKPTD